MIVPSVYVVNLSVVFSVALAGIAVVFVVRKALGLLQRS